MQPTSLEHPSTLVKPLAFAAAAAVVAWTPEQLAKYREALAHLTQQPGPSDRQQSPGSG